MKNFDRLKEMINKNADCFAEIKEINTGLEGIADLTLSNKVAVYYGADDGSNDKIISAEEFDNNFKIIGIAINN